MNKLSEALKDVSPEELAKRRSDFRWVSDDEKEAQVEGDASSLNSEDIELELVRIYAKSWNNLSFEILEPYLADDVEYSSQIVFASVVGKLAVSDHLADKMELIRDDLPVSKVYAEVGICGNESGRRVQLFGSEGRPCVLLAQGDISSTPLGLVLLETTGKLIKQIGICTVVPHPTSAIRTGEYPQ